MNKRITVGALGLAAAATMAVALDAGQLTPYINAMGSAQSLDIAYTINTVGGSQTQYHVVLSKPDKAMVDTPTTTYVADGKEITVYNKARNTYFKKQQTKQGLEQMFNEDETSVWKPFFNSKAFDSFAGAKFDGTRKRGAETLKTITANVDPNGEFTIRLYVDQADNLIRQAEFINVNGAASRTSILNVVKMSKSTDDSDFTFTAPSGAKQLTEADMLTAEWIDNNLDKALELAAATGKGVMIDVYADW